MLTSRSRLRGRRRGCRARCREVYFRRYARSLRRLEVSVIPLESSPSGEDVSRELLHVRVVVLQRVVVPLALDGDPILSARQFILQPQEIFVRLQLRIVFYDEQQATQSAV